jgi:hypothetical protein
MEVPENWTVIEFPNGLRKVYAGWRGGYASSDAWRLNSGIVNTEETDDYYDFSGASGSVYRCYKKAEGITGMYLNEILRNFLEKGQAKIINYGETNED